MSRSSAQPQARKDLERLAPARNAARRSQATSPLQLELFGPRPVLAPDAPRPVGDPSALRFHLLRQLNRLTGGRLRSLELTDNRRTILSVRAGRTGFRAPLELRIHHSFTAAPEEVLQAVATFVESKRGSDLAREALVVIREHFTAHRETARARKVVLRPEGVAFDLREVFADLNERYFEGRLAVAISWGKSAISSHCRRRRSASLQLGSYSYEDRLIRLHRVLDHAEVPRYVVEAVVYHEMLHADMPPEIRGGKRYFHTPEFRRRERIYRNLTRAERWIGDNMPALLKARAGMSAVKRAGKISRRPAL
jgi:predicted metal-dependent hydrolase